MNRIYQIIWSRAKHGWVVVAETARLASLGSTSSRKALKLLALALMLGMTAEVQALPQGGSVTGGSGNIGGSGNSMIIIQSTPSLLINWQSFNIAAGESVAFFQPKTGVAINTVVGGGAASQILGNVFSTGQVWLVNPNGVLFGPNATVNVGGLGVSTLNLQSTTGSTFNFAGNGTGSIINQGNIQAREGGYVAFIANQVSNQGSIKTPGGNTVLVGGSDVTVNFPSIGPVSIRINASTLNNLAENTATGYIQASHGQVIMSAGAANSLLASAVNTDGIIEATRLPTQGGAIYLKAGGSRGVVTLRGILDVSHETVNLGFLLSIPENGYVDVEGQKINSSNVKVGIKQVLISNDYGYLLKDYISFGNYLIYKGKSEALGGYIEYERSYDGDFRSTFDYFDEVYSLESTYGHDERFYLISSSPLERLGRSAARLSDLIK